MSLQSVCKLTDILPDTGVCALVEGQQVAVFHVKNGNESVLYAISNHDPFSGANVLSRGMVGGTGDAIYVASPIYKQRFNLATGECLDDDTVSVERFAAELDGDQVMVGVKEMA